MVSRKKKMPSGKGNGRVKKRLKGTSANTVVEDEARMVGDGAITLSSSVVFAMANSGEQGRALIATGDNANILDHDRVYDLVLRAQQYDLQAMLDDNGATHLSVSLPVGQDGLQDWKKQLHAVRYADLIPVATFLIAF